MTTDPLPDDAPAAPATEPTEQAGGHHFRINAAAKACGVSRTTMRRRRESGAFPHAYTDAAGAWVIPLSDLLGAGLTPGKSTSESGGQNEAASTTEQPVFRGIEQGGQAMTIALDEWQELIEARAERNALRDQLQRADEARNEALKSKDEALKSAWAWHEQAQLVQRQLPQTATPVVDVRDQAPTDQQPARRAGLFRR